MAKTYHKYIGSDGFAVYRASDRVYVSVNPANGSFSSKMLPGNIPVERLAQAPKIIRVKGEAFGHKVVRSYLEGERPITHTIAFKGDCGYAPNKYNPDGCPADPDKVFFDNYAYTDQQRDSTARQIAHIRDSIARRIKGQLREFESSYSCDEVTIVELN